jgi:hypothetical protein
MTVDIDDDFVDFVDFVEYMRYFVDVKDGIDEEKKQGSKDEK